MPAYHARQDHRRNGSTGWRRSGVPCGPVNNLDQVFADPQVQARGMRVDVPHPTAAAGTVPLVANPIKMCRTPPGYRHARRPWASTPTRCWRSCCGWAKPSAPQLRAAGTIG